jgi:hypothetical protein
MVSNETSTSLVFNVIGHADYIGKMPLTPRASSRLIHGSHSLTWFWKGSPDLERVTPYRPIALLRRWNLVPSNWQRGSSVPADAGRSRAFIYRFNTPAILPNGRLRGLEYKTFASPRSLRTSTNWLFQTPGLRPS